MNTDITKQMEMVLYRTEDDNVTVSALIKDETIWITKKAMAELFGVQTPAISKHLKNIFEQGELREEVVVSKMEIPTPHGAIPGKTQLSLTNYYNLDAIISVGYRVNSIQATKFRIWATSILKEYMIKGFAHHRRLTCFRQLFRAAKHSSIFCDRESSICFFLDEASKFCKVVKQILILIAMAGENIENQRFGIWNEK